MMIKILKAGNVRFWTKLLLVLLPFAGFSQETTKINVEGRVVSGENGEPLPGVSISVQGASTGTETDLEGRYSLAVTAGATLVVDLVGFHSDRKRQRLNSST